MKRTFLTLTLAAQLAATGAFAQTSATTADPGMTSGSFGSDWSSALGSAFFGEGGTTLRSESELASQWGTLSEEDKEMVRRDCMAYTQQSGDTTGTTGTSAGGTGTLSAGSTGSGTNTATTGSADATASTGTTAGSTGAADTTAGQSGTSGTASGATATGTSPMINVTMEQMEEICAATDDL